MKLVCSWCCKPTRTKPCEHCGNDCTVTDADKPHRTEWSRKTITQVECKICGRTAPINSNYYEDNQCPGLNP